MFNIEFCLSARLFVCLFDCWFVYTFIFINRVLLFYLYHRAQHLHHTSRLGFYSRRGRLNGGVRRGVKTAVYTAAFLHVGCFTVW